MMKESEINSTQLDSDAVLIVVIHQNQWDRSMLARWPQSIYFKRLNERCEELRSKSP